MTLGALAVALLALAAPAWAEGPPLEAFLLSPPYRGALFDDEPRLIRVEVVIPPPTAAARRLRLTLTLHDAGVVVASRSYSPLPVGRFVAALEPPPLRHGVIYRLRATLREDDRMVAEHPGWDIVRYSVAERAQMALTFDATGHVLLRGRPRFLLGVYDSGLDPPATVGDWDTTLFAASGARRLRGVPINLYLNYQLGHLETDRIRPLLDALSARGVSYVHPANCFGDRPARASAFPTDTSDDYVRTLVRHPAFAGIFTADECDLAMLPGVAAQYQRLRALAPGTVTLGGFPAHSGLARWPAALDLLATDPYPLASGASLALVAEWTRRARAAVRERRPIVTVIQFFRGERRDSRWPTTAEVRAMSYLAVVEGAQGLMYWSLGTRGLAGVCGRPGWCEERADRMNGLTAVVKEIADLEPALLAAPVQGFLEVTPPAVRVKVARVEGRVWVVAVNASSQRVEAQFVAQAALRDVRVRGDERHALSIGERQWLDTLEAWDRRVYLVQ